MTGRAVSNQSEAHEPPPRWRLQSVGTFGRWIRRQRTLPAAVGILCRWLPLMRNLTTFFALLLPMLLFTGCASTVCMESKRDLQRFDGGARPVFVTNPDLGREYEMLRASQIYHLVSQPDGARKLTLHPARQYARCANPLMLSALTVGIIPGFLPGARAFEYDLETDGVAGRYVHYLPVYERISIWEWLVRRNEEKLFAEALAWSARQPRIESGARTSLTEQWPNNAGMAPKIPK